MWFFDLKINKFQNQNGGYLAVLTSTHQLLITKSCHFQNKTVYTIIFYPVSVWRLFFSFPLSLRSLLLNSAADKFHPSWGHESFVKNLLPDFQRIGQHPNIAARFGEAPRLTLWCCHLSSTLVNVTITISLIKLKSSS